ncbi:MAG TPA: hypothetical protein VH350_10605 [Candidatus Sulfotelmatobacter sp.]|jgi:hypothetical protein|nr:hypothetical protein [Candidatus Sulfotelmatobacter sp.]
MTPEESDRMKWLCERIKEEKHPETFNSLIRELNDLLGAKHQRIHPQQKTNPKPTSRSGDIKPGTAS